MKLIIKIVTAFAFLVSVSGLAVAHHIPCGNEWSSGKCEHCTGDWGRAYESLGPGYCIVCLAFCPGGDRLIKAADRESMFAGEERLFLQVDASALSNLGVQNPEAAALLHYLSVNSLKPEVPLSTRGQTHGNGLFNSLSLSELLRDGSSPESVAERKEPIETEGLVSTVKYEMIKHSGDTATMRIRHRLTDPSNVEVKKLYPDVAGVLRWISTGRAGYWRLVAFETEPNL